MEDTEITPFSFFPSFRMDQSSATETREAPQLYYHPLSSVSVPSFRSFITQLLNIY